MTTDEVVDSELATLCAKVEELTKQRDAALELAEEAAKKSVEYKLKFCREFHEAWYGPCTPWIPVTSSGVMAVGAMLKAGRYSSGANLISSARLLAFVCSARIHCNIALV